MILLRTEALLSTEGVDGLRAAWAAAVQDTPLAAVPILILPAGVEVEVARHVNTGVSPMQEVVLPESLR